jgi:demethoxyubiquinone hydroxylase (CLK1/Coq7/Cat5 family)
MTSNPKQKLIRILQNAYSGEVAAAYAYRGHWKSLKDSPEKIHIKKIEDEEWRHRENVGRWLAELGAGPRKLREKVFWTIGRALGLSCFVSGWFFPMYFAGRLESQNVLEYEEAARHARELGMDRCVEELMEMSAVEGEHEVFFRTTVAGHDLLPIMKKVFGWG